MVDRQEVEALLEYVEMKLQSDKVELPPTVSDDTLAALCRAWLAVDAGLPGWVCGADLSTVTATVQLDEWPGAVKIGESQRVRIVKEDSDE